MTDKQEKELIKGMISVLHKYDIGYEDPSDYDLSNEEERIGLDGYLGDKTDFFYALEAYFNRIRNKELLASIGRQAIS